MKLKVCIVLSALFLSGCNTVQGIGRDIQTVGQVLENSAQRAQR